MSLGQEVIANTRTAKEQIIPALALRDDDSAVADSQNVDVMNVVRKRHRLCQTNGLTPTAGENRRTGHSHIRYLRIGTLELAQEAVAALGRGIERLLGGLLAGEGLLEFVLDGIADQRE